MNNDVINILTMAKLIQTAVAPVFLITGIAATLGVLSNRLARITDRARQLERKLKVSTDEDFNKSLATELRALLKRSRCIHIAFSLSVLSALLVCAVVMLLFLSHIQSINLGVTIASCFVAAMALLICAFMSLLGEVFLATRSMRRGQTAAPVQYAEPSNKQCLLGSKENHRSYPRLVNKYPTQRHTPIKNALQLESVFLD